MKVSLLPRGAQSSEMEANQINRPRFSLSRSGSDVAKLKDTYVQQRRTSNSNPLISVTLEGATERMLRIPV